MATGHRVHRASRLIMGVDASRREDLGAVLADKKSIPPPIAGLHPALRFSTRMHRIASALVHEGLSVPLGPHDDIRLHARLHRDRLARRGRAGEDHAATAGAGMIGCGTTARHAPASSEKVSKVPRVSWRHYLRKTGCDSITPRQWRL